MAEKSILFNLWYANRNFHVHCNDRITLAKDLTIIDSAILSHVTLLRSHMYEFYHF